MDFHQGVRSWAHVENVTPNWVLAALLANFSLVLVYSEKYLDVWVLSDEAGTIVPMISLLRVRLAESERMMIDIE